MNKPFRFLLAGLCLFGFLFIRFRESILFYDPLIDYFHGDYLNNELPDFRQGELFLNLFYRYLLNTVLSLGLLWAAFRDTQIIKFSCLFYGISFCILLSVMYVLLQGYDPKVYLPLFYVRRFLIQPILVLLLLPAFFYSRKVNT